VRSVIPTSALATAVFAVALVSGCSTSTAGSAAPDAPTAGADAGSTQGTGSADPSEGNAANAGTGDNAGTDGSGSGAPKVTTALDTTRFQSTPCSVLTTAQQQALGITKAGKPTPDPAGATCNWDLASPVAVYGFGFDVTFPAGQAKGLGNAYQAGGSQMKALPDIGGQPAVTQPSQNTGGNCTIWVGATDEIEYAATVSIATGPHASDPCTVATRIATDATTTMRSRA
jgi:hypothetical protein